MTSKELAHKVLEMFKEQEIYFKTRNPLQLTKCKKIEADLKRYCKEILNPNLFSNDY